MAVPAHDPLELPLIGRFAVRLSERAHVSERNEDYAKAKLCLTDFLASAFAARQTTVSEQVLRVVRAAATNARPAASVIGTEISTTAADAAFANAVLGHGLVRDDMHLGSVSHLSVTVIPALLALAQQRPISGSNFLDGIVAGYEAGGKLGRAVLDIDVAKIHRPTGITGPFAAAAAAARTLGFDADTAAHAMAIAANTAAGFNEWAETGGAEMFLQPGFAARNALLSIALAEAGIFASPSALDGPAGLLASFRKRWPADLPLPYEDRSEIQSVFFKEVPACNYAQSPAQAARLLATRHRLDCTDVERIIVDVSAAAAHYPGCDCIGPFEHVLQAKMSIQYNVAAALFHGHFDELNFQPERQPMVTALARHVEVRVDSALTQAYPRRQGAQVSVTMRGGETLRLGVDDVAPASTELVRERLLSAATAVLGEPQANELQALIDGFETCESAARLARLTQP